MSHQVREISSSRAGRQALGPEIAGIAHFAELGLCHRNCSIGRLRVEHTLDGRLEPTRHGNVVGIDAPAILRQLAVVVENVSGPGRTCDDAPKARTGGVDTAIFITQADKRILASETHMIWICSANQITSPAVRRNHNAGLASAPPAANVREVSARCTLDVADYDPQRIAPRRC